MESDVEERPPLSLLERCRFLEQATGIGVSKSTMSRVLRHLGFSRKKVAWVPVSGTNFLQQVALILTHAHHLLCMTLARKSCAGVDASVMGMVQLHCNPL